MWVADLGFVLFCLILDLLTFRSPFTQPFVAFFPCSRRPLCMNYGRRPCVVYRSAVNYYGRRPYTLCNINSVTVFVCFVAEHAGSHVLCGAQTMCTVFLKFKVRSPTTCNRKIFYDWWYVVWRLQQLKQQQQRYPTMHCMSMRCLHCDQQRNPTTRRHWKICPNQTTRRNRQKLSPYAFYHI